MPKKSTMNRNEHYPSLQNTYVVWRHGQSEANIGHVIVSKKEHGLTHAGLTSYGKEQVRAAARTFSPVIADIILVTSPFRRCTETASLIAQELAFSGDIFVSDALRERDFGELEGTHSDNYQRVYEYDQQKAEHTAFSVETTGQVLARTRGLLKNLELRYTDKTIVLATHADVGEILQTSFVGLPPHLHRQLPKLHNAEYRELHIPRLKGGDNHE